MMKESRARTILASHTAIAQKVYAAIPIQDVVDELSYTPRGEGGFGSTGAS